MKDSLQKDFYILDKKYKKAQQKNRKLEDDLKQTRDQVSEFKQRFRTLSTFIQKKGGIETLSSLPNVCPDPSTSSKPYASNTPSDSQNPRLGATSNLNQQKITVRGQAPSQNVQANKTVIRGGAAVGKAGSPGAPCVAMPIEGNK